MTRNPDTLYLMRVGEWLKVGITCNVASRRQSVKSEKGRPVTVLRTWFVGPDVRKVELIAVGRLKLCRAQGREYFDADESTVMAAINKALSMWGRCATEPRMRAAFDTYRKASDVAIDLNVSRQSIYSRVGSREVRELRRKAKAVAIRTSA